MSTQISGRLGSEIFELSAEAGQKSFSVHKNLLVEQSELLRTAVMQATDKKIDLGSWDGETVSHLVDFLYLRTYKVKPPEPLCPTRQFTESTISDTSETDSRSDTPDTVRDRSPDAIHRRPLTPLRELIESHDAQNNPAGCNPAPAEVEDSYSILYPLETHEYSGILFAHANVYALAQSLGIDDLQRMAYRSLAVILDSFKPIDPDSHIATITIELLSHVYGNTRSLRDPMRILVSQFAALNFPALEGMDQMKELVRQGGELVVDLVEKVCRRLVASESEPEITHPVMPSPANPIPPPARPIPPPAYPIPRPARPISPSAYPIPRPARPISPSAYPIPRPARPISPSAWSIPSPARPIQPPAIPSPLPTPIRPIHPWLKPPYGR